MSESYTSRIFAIIVLTITASVLILPHVVTVLSSQGIRYPLLNHLSNILNKSISSVEYNSYTDEDVGEEEFNVSNDAFKMHYVTPMNTDKGIELIEPRSDTTNVVNGRCVKRLPTAIIAGIQKCGTSALGTFLNLHPKIVHASAEPHFFTSKYSKGYEWYRKRMPCSYPGQITIEKSPPYFYRFYVPMRIKRYNPKTKIVLIVKDPIVRSLSMYAMIYRGTANKFEEEVTHKSDKIQENCKIIRYSTYRRFIKTWLDTFKRDQIHFVDGHNLEKHPDQELRILEKFLNISSYFQPGLFWYNLSKGKQCFYKNFNKDKPGCLGSNKGRKHPDITKEFRKKMENFFRPLNEEFFKMIGRSFDWGY